MLDVAIKPDATIAYADAVLFHRFQPRAAVETDAEIYAMSIIGPEQAVRAIQSTCVVGKGGRHVYGERRVYFAGPSGVVAGYWRGPWRSRCQQVEFGLHHLVAMPEPDFKATDDAEQEKRPAHVVLPSGSARDDDPDWLRAMPIWRDIYYRLMAAYTTPLLGLDQPGAGGEESEVAHLVENAAALHWCERIVSRIILESNWWRPLVGHPDQSNHSWHGAGVLSIQQGELDKVVSDMVRTREIGVPDVRAA